MVEFGLDLDLRPYWSCVPDSSLSWITLLASAWPLLCEGLSFLDNKTAFALLAQASAVVLVSCQENDSSLNLEPGTS